MDAADIERKVRSGERLSRADGIALYDCDDPGPARRPRAPGADAAQR